MKKYLLSIMSTGLISSPISYVVSCNTKVNDNSDENCEENPNNDLGDSYETIKQEYLEKIKKLINIEVKKSIVNWTEQGGTIKNKFFNNNYLKKILDYKNVGRTIEKSISEVLKNNLEAKENFYYDLKQKINFNLIIDEVSKVAKDPKYSILVGGLEKNKLLSIDQNYYESKDKKSILKYYEPSDKVNKDIKYISVLENFEIKFQIFYKSKLNNSTLEIEPTFGKFNFTVTTYEALLDYINNQLKDIKYKFFIERDSIIKTSKKTGDLFEDKDVINSKYLDLFKKDNNLYKKLEEIIKPPINNGLEVKIKDDAVNDGIVDNLDSWDNEYTSKNSPPNYFNWKNDFKNIGNDDLDSNEKLYDYIFKNDKYILSVYDYIKENYSKWLDTYIEKVNYEDSETYNKEDFIKVLSKTVKYKNAPIKNLEILIDNGKFKFDVPNFILAVGYQIDDNLIDKNNTKLIYGTTENLLKGIKTFKETFGVQETSNDYKLIKFKGVFKDSTGNNLNIWDSLNEKYIDPDGNGESNEKHENWLKIVYTNILDKFNKFLSLELTDSQDPNTTLIQKEAKHIINKQGNQNIFEWKFSKKYKPYVRLLKNIGDVDVKKLDSEKRDTKGITVDGYYIPVNSFADVEFKLDFINVVFRIKEMFNSKNGKRFQSLIELGE
ncbi:hypothetical protein [Spiroplasma turonicum]|uniref:Uncharacterized protein n=1 Tax=Spiroplasma turonicum TaxID=216946 RepID=A0A0K1P7V6_9MOLU|nr:hypothetical protein [Spiroplasma turonicum]AKU79967.1 hypothetical protein STURON_00721 [Spiroplasma turonicum]ALX70978.1 hypothetical protein STURO_v1c07210 [Spiroplasma turonicum]